MANNTTYLQMEIVHIDLAETKQKIENYRKRMKNFNNSNDILSEDIDYC